MPALLLVKATGHNRGRVTSVLPHTQDPGARVRQNAAGQWAFVYLLDADPGDVWQLTAAEVRRPNAAVINQAEETVRDRAEYIDLDALPTAGSGDWTTYRPFTAARSYKVTSAQINASRRAESGRQR